MSSLSHLQPAAQESTAICLGPLGACPRSFWVWRNTGMDSLTAPRSCPASVRVESSAAPSVQRACRCAGGVGLYRQSCSAHRRLVQAFRGMLYHAGMVGARCRGNLIAAGVKDHSCQPVGAALDWQTKTTSTPWCRVFVHVTPHRRPHEHRHTSSNGASRV